MCDCGHDEAAHAVTDREEMGCDDCFCIGYREKNDN